MTQTLFKVGDLARIRAANGVKEGVGRIANIIFNNGEYYFNIQLPDRLKVIHQSYLMALPSVERREETTSAPLDIQVAIYSAIKRLANACQRAKCPFRRQ